jgi:glucosamine--fructose-6-phosphate aminotransferase (isomerizing)
VDVEIASELRYRDPILPPRTLVLGISESGESADTLAAIRLARERGAIVVAVTNVPGSQVTRCSDAVLFTRAGLEAGAGAVGTFIAQVVLLYSFALRLAEVRFSHRRAAGVVEPGQAEARLLALRSALELLPGQIAGLLESSGSAVQTIATRLAECPFVLYLGGHASLPVALEGALRLRELSCIPTDTYPAGEMRYGPIGLLNSETPVVCVATGGPALPTLLSNLAEIRVRQAPVVAVASGEAGGRAEQDAALSGHAEDVIHIPRADPVMQIPLAVIPLQLLAYHVARHRGLDVDRASAPAQIAAVK